MQPTTVGNLSTKDNISLNSERGCLLPSGAVNGLSDSKESISDMTASVSLSDSDLLTDSVSAVSSEFCSLPSESDTAVWKESKR